MKSKLLVSALALTAALAVAGMAQGQTQSHGSRPGMGSDMDPAVMQKMMHEMMPAGSDSPSTKDYKQVGMSMMKNMNVTYTGDPDVDFRTHMIPHHQGAIDMAKVALEHAKDPDTKKMAQKIIDDQKKEIVKMQDWLKMHRK